jgi:hypothetical protein
VQAGGAGDDRAQLDVPGVRSGLDRHPGDQGRGYQPDVGAGMNWFRNVTEGCAMRRVNRKSDRISVAVALAVYIVAMWAFLGLWLLGQINGTPAVLMISMALPVATLVFLFSPRNERS